MTTELYIRCVSMLENIFHCKLLWWNCKSGYSHKSAPSAWETVHLRLFWFLQISEGFPWQHCHFSSHSTHLCSVPCAGRSSNSSLKINYLWMDKEDWSWTSKTVSKALNLYSRSYKASIESVAVLSSSSEKPKNMRQPSLYCDKRDNRTLSVNIFGDFFRT